jgi:lysophospholipase L1-like esterase
VLLALILGSLAVLGSLELIARLAPPPRYHREPLELDDRFGFRGIPGYRTTFRDERGEFVFELGPEGFRGAALPRAAKVGGEEGAGAAGAGRAEAEPRRIVFLGDSFLVGLGLREEALLPARIAAALAADEGEDESGSPEHRPVEVTNLAIIDTGTAQQWLAFRAYAERLDPDVVVLALYPGNDLVNNTRALAGWTRVSPGDYARPYLAPEMVGVPGPESEPETAAESERLAVSGSESVTASGSDRAGGPAGWRREYVHPVRALLRNCSRLFALAEHRLLALGWLDPWPPRSGQIDRLRRHEPPEAWMEIFQSSPPRPQSGSAWELAWQRTFDLLRGLREDVRARGAELVVVVIPNQGQVERNARFLALDYQTRRFAGVALDRLLDWNGPEKRIARFLEQEEIPGVVLLEPLRAAVREGLAVYGRDGHLSPEGHRVAAERLRPVLRLALAAKSRQQRKEGADGAEAMPAWSVPVDRLSPVSETAGSVIDFGWSPHPEQLGDGWGQWQPPEGDRPGGWWLIGRAMLVLPASPGRLVVEGWRPQNAEGAIVLRLELPGAGGQSLRIDRPGPFSIEQPVSPQASLAPVDGYVPVLISPVRMEVPAAGPQILIRAAGFRP